MPKTKKLSSNKKYQEFFKGFFKQEEGYEELKVNNFWLIKHWDGAQKIWVVYLYTDEGYRNYKIGQAIHRQYLNEVI